MREKLQKTPLYKRKIVFYLVVAVTGVFLFSAQFFITMKRAENPDFVLLPSLQVEKVAEGIQERSGKVEEIYRVAKDEIGGAIKIDEEELIRQLQEEGMLDTEDAEELLLGKEGLEEGELLDLINEKLIKEKNGAEEE